MRPAHFGVGVGVDAKLRDLVGCGQQRLEHGLERQLLGRGQGAGDPAGVGGNLPQRAGSVKVLRAADEPDLGGGKGFHGENSERGWESAAGFNDR
jgi:hypothetical protein